MLTTTTSAPAARASSTSRGHAGRVLGVGEAPLVGGQVRVRVPGVGEVGDAHAAHRDDRRRELLGPAGRPGPRDPGLLERVDRRVDPGVADVVAVVGRGGAAVEARRRAGPGPSRRGEQPVAAVGGTSLGAGLLVGPADRQLHLADRQVVRLDERCDRREQRPEVETAAGRLGAPAPGVEHRVLDDDVPGEQHAHRPGGVGVDGGGGGRRCRRRGRVSVAVVVVASTGGATATGMTVVVGAVDERGGTRT